MDLNGQGVIVTGASRGLGEALASQIAARGGRVVAVARHEAPLRAVVDAIRARGHEAHALVADIADKGAIYPLAGAAAAMVGPIELLIHNASALGPVPLRLLLDTECEDLEAVLQTNLVGPFRLTKVIAGAMALRGSGLILHISSDAAVVPYPRWGAYGVSKAAQDHLARILAAELAETSVKILSLDPGEMDTVMHADAIPDADRSSLEQPGSVAERIVDLIEHAERVETGSRVEASKWELRR
jgi:short-subunit dehydrogenase